jgi:hypothetical protein
VILENRWRSGRRFDSKRQRYRGVTQPEAREDRMNKLMVPAVIAATGFVAAATWSQAPQQRPPFQATRYFETPLEKDGTRVVRLQSEFMPPGSGNEFHVHPGDQWSAVQEG